MVKNMRIRALVAMALLLATVGTDAKDRTDAEMRHAALRILNANGIKRAAPNGGSSALKQLSQSGYLAVYGYDDGGFVVVSTDDLAPAVLGYSDSKIQDGTANPNFAWWMQSVGQVVSYAVANNTPIQRTAKPDVSRHDASVAPLVTSRWDQKEPYWRMCPTNASGSRCLTGCVATSFAQILNYHKAPASGIGSRTIYYPYNNPNGVAVTADFASDAYDWANMLDDYSGSYTEEQAQAVALLMRDCGVAVNMEYGTAAEDGSGAYHDEASEGMNKYFGLETKYYERSKYTEREWMDMIYEQLTERLPLVYGGSSWSSGGHSFVFDGYDADGLVHVNWGWSGSEDGYFDVAVLDPGYYNFSQGQDMILNINPERLGLSVSDTIKLDRAGTLAAHIVDSLVYSYDTLRVEGEVNGTDLRLMRSMAGRDYNGEKTTGRLRVLDLSDARIVAGGDYYLHADGKELRPTGDGALPERLFYGCSLKQIYLPDSISHFGEGALSLCTRLDSVLLRPSADADFIVSGQAVYAKDTTRVIAALPRLADGTVPRSVKVIGDFAYAGNMRITEVVLPATIDTIGREAFNGCNGLSSVRTRSKTPPTLGGAFVFGSPSSNKATLYVPAGTATLYKAAAQWSSFKTMIEFGTTVKGRNCMRKYGEPNPQLGYRIEGTVVDGRPEVVCDALPTTPVGRYPIRVLPGTITSEDVEYVEGFLIITAAPLTVTALDTTRKAGEDNPKFVLAYDGFKNGETDTVFTERPTVVCDADKLSAEGVYDIIVSGGKAENYELSYVNGKLTVAGKTSGISSVKADDAHAADVYTLDGRLVGHGTDCLDNLSRGVYIMGNRKIVVGK